MTATPVPPVDTDLRFRVLGLAANYAVDTGWADPIELAELMLNFVEGRSSESDDIVHVEEGEQVRVTVRTDSQGTLMTTQGALVDIEFVDD